MFIPINILPIRSKIL